MTLSCLLKRRMNARMTSSLLLAGAVFVGVTSIVFPSPAYAESVAVETHYYKVPAGPLVKAVNAFAAVSGMYLGGNGELLKGKNTLGFEGEYSEGQALDLLLIGTGLSYELGEGRSIVLIDSNVIFEDDSGVNLSPLLIRAEQTPVTIGASQLDADQIESMAGENGNLTDLLQGNGAVRYSLSSGSSANSATMRPDEVSIHGQSHYQNSFIIDGMSANNDLNPGDSEDTFSNPINPSNLGMLSGSSSQSFYIDPSALESVTVYDSNVPVQYGGFLGGVISAKLKRYDGEDYLSLKYKIERDEWDEMHADESLEEDMAEGDSIEADYTPEYLKQRYTITGAQGITDKLGMTFTASRGNSNFDQSYVKNIGNTIYGKQGVSYDDTVDDFNARFDYKANEDLDISMSILYANRYHDGITNASYDGAFVKSHKASGINSEVLYKSDAGLLTATLSYNEASDVLSSDSSTYTYHYVDFYNGNWPYSGSYGNVNQQQNSTELKIDWLQNAFNVGDVKHRIQAGLELSYRKQFYQVNDDIVSENYQCINAGCGDTNSDGIIDYDDEYLRILNMVSANKFEKTSHSEGLYFSDNIKIGDWDYYLGLRADYNSTLENLDFSPRTSVTWDVFSDDRTHLIAGANRYYGRDFFRYEVNSQLRSWRSMYRYNTDGSLNRVTVYDDNSFYDYELDTPYSDELVFGVVQRIGKVDATLKFVNRETRDMVTRTETAEGLDYYDNSGQSSTDTISLEFKTRQPFEIGETQTNAKFTISYQESKINVLSDVSYEDSISSEEVYYKGRVIYESQLPKMDFNIPFSIALSTETSFPEWRLIWANSIHVKAGGTIAQDTREDYSDSSGNYDIYDDIDFDDLITLNTSFEWKPHLLDEVEGYLKVSINNVFDDYINRSTSTSTFSYSKGRSTSLEVGMRF